MSLSSPPSMPTDVVCAKACEIAPDTPARPIENELVLRMDIQSSSPSGAWPTVTVPSLMIVSIPDPPSMPVTFVLTSVPATLPVAPKPA